jgi:excisionase family DNA binding protein
MIREVETVDELAARWKVPKTWIYERTRKGLLPFIKIGRYIRFEPDKVDEALKNQNKE